MELRRWNFFKHRLITGCEAHGQKDDLYLERWILVETPWGAIYLHKFHRSDGDELHDHPWNFVSVILRNGYLEWSHGEVKHGLRLGQRCEWISAGRIIYRPANWAHRVELIRNQPAWSLVFRGPYIRMWGFFTAKGWQDFRAYFAERGC